MDSGTAMLHHEVSQHSSLPVPESRQTGIESKKLTGDERYAVAHLEFIDHRLSLGRMIADVNPELNIEEIYEIGEAVEKYSALHGLDPYLVIAIIIVESSGRSFAVSPKGAVGLMQVMPHMAEELGLDADLFEIDTNIRLGTFILADNIRRWGYHEGIERYFWGTGAADNRYISKVLRVMEGFKG